MSILVTTLLSLLPKVFIYLLSKIINEKLLRDVIKTIVLFALHKIVDYTSNNLDNELLTKLEAALNEPDKNE